MTSKDDLVIIMRRPCLQEDEGRPTFIAGPWSKDDAKAWIATAPGRSDYFKPDDYYLISAKEVE